MLEVVYAIFNEGYVATAGEALQRVDLAHEAVRLAELVALLLPESADARAMLALVTLIHARRAAPIVALNEAVARAMVQGPAAALADLDALDRGGTLAGHHALPAARADVLRRVGRHDEARAAYDAAIASTRNEVERRTARADGFPVTRVPADGPPPALTGCGRWASYPATSSPPRPASCRRRR